MNDQNKIGRRKTSQRKERTDSDRHVATLCIIYLLLLLVFFSWQLFDTWIGQHFLPSAIGYDSARLNTGSFRLVAFTVIGGGLGGIINGIRSLLNYYNGFNRHYAWKYISTPWMGATLALFVYALIHSSIVILGGNVSNTGTAQVLSNFAAGALAGYGSKDVFIWLDTRVHSIFQVTERVREVKGKSKNNAASNGHSEFAEPEVSNAQKNGHAVSSLIDHSRV